MSARGGKKKGAKKKAPAWKCAWCPQTEGQQKQGPHGPKTLCGKCNLRWGSNGETGPRAADWTCGWCGVKETPRRMKGPKGRGTLCEPCGQRHSRGQAREGGVGGPAPLHDLHGSRRAAFRPLWAVQPLPRLRLVRRRAPGVPELPRDDHDAHHYRELELGRGV